MKKLMKKIFQKRNKNRNRFPSFKNWIKWRAFDNNFLKELLEKANGKRTRPKANRINGLSL